MRFVSIRLRWISWRSTTEVILNICNWTVWRMKIKHLFVSMSRSETRTVRQHSNSRELSVVIINVRLRLSNPLIPQSGRLLSNSLLVCILDERKRIWSAVIEKFSLDPVKPVLVRESQGSRHISLQWTFASVTNIQSFDLFENNQSIFSSNVTDYLANQTQFSRNITDGLLPFHTYALFDRRSQKWRWCLYFSYNYSVRVQSNREIFSDLISVLTDEGGELHLSWNVSGTLTFPFSS